MGLLEVEDPAFDEPNGRAVFDPHAQGRHADHRVRRFQSLHDHTRRRITRHDAPRGRGAVPAVAAVRADERGAHARGAFVRPRHLVGEREVHARERADKWLAQTPQMFRLGDLQQALQAAGSAVTDESSAMEFLGKAPRLVAGSAQNFKVTYPQDFALAQAVLQARNGDTA